MHTGYSTNQYGTPISTHICDTCGEPFTLCPGVEPEREDWDNCLATTCDSYDPMRDVDLLMGWSES